VIRRQGSAKIQKSFQEEKEMDNHNARSPHDEEKLDQSLRAKLREAAAPPAGLEEEILHGFREPKFQPAKILFFRPLAIAASIALILATALFLLNRRPDRTADDLTTFRIEMAAFLKEFPKLDYYSEKQADLRQWLGEREHFSRLNIPSALEKFPTIGCREISWQGKKAALLCFVVDGEVIHLISLPLDEWNGFTGSQAQFSKQSGRNVATWKQGNAINVAITAGSEKFLRKSLALPEG
jgi:hypothetical protein